MALFLLNNFEQVMNNRALALILAAFASVINSVEAQSNSSNVLILPAPDWNPKTHILAALVATNKPGEYPLTPAWVGEERVTMRTGWYEKEYEFDKQSNLPRRTNDWHRFDMFELYAAPVVPRDPTVRVICEMKGKQQTCACGYRPSLPTDSELTKMCDVSSVSNFFGWNYFRNFHPATNQPAAVIGRRYFTLGPYDSINTLYVEFWKSSLGTNIDGILIKRGRFHLQQKQ